MEEEKKNKKYLIYLVVGFITLIICLLIFRSCGKSKITIILSGEENIELGINSSFIEPGYKAFDNKNNDLTKKVIVNSNLDPSKEGTYTITYKLGDVVKTRTIKITNNYFGDISFNLIGSNTMNISLNEKFVDPLFVCKNNKTGKNLKDKVSISGNVNTSKLGKYTITYTLVENGKKYTLTRTVNVISATYILIADTEEATNGDVNITFASNISNFSHVILPNGLRSTQKITNYVVHENGVYEFIMYDEDNNVTKAQITISNIDKQGPVISSCSGKAEGNKTTLNIVTSDKDIASYTINGKKYNWSSSYIELSGLNQTLTITFYDKLGNSTNVNCNIEYIPYDSPITPSGSETIIASEYTDTLKVWIESKKRSGRTSYYVTHVWAKDPYNQFKLKTPENFGNQVDFALGIINGAINKNGFNNKLLVAVNASGFVIKNSFGHAHYYLVNNAFNYTAGIPLILSDGKVMRNIASEKLPQTMYYTYGLKKDGNLAAYTYPGGYNPSENSAVANRIISDGVKNTFGFNPVLVTNSKAVANATARNIRQGFCQIDKNNFVFITDVYVEARNGFSFEELANYMISLGCKTGFNLDGGGSTSLIFKSKNSSAKVITGNKRRIADVIYFHE